MYRSTFAAILMSCAAAAVAVATPVVVSADEAKTHRLEDVAGAAVVAAMRDRFGGRDVDFKLATLDADRLSLRDMQLAGEGRLRVEGSDGWLPVRFEALYDTATGTVLPPAVTLERMPSIAADTPTVGLGDAVGEALAAEFAMQPVSFELDSAWHSAGSGRYAVVDGEGVARFEGEGAAEVRLQAVYDLQDERWVDVDYVLGAEPTGAATAVAVR